MRLVHRALSHRTVTQGRRAIGVEVATSTLKKFISAVTPQFSWGSRSSLLIAASGVSPFVVPKTKVTCACQRRGGLDEAVRMPRPPHDQCLTRIKNE